MRSFERSHITKQCTCSTPGTIIFRTEENYSNTLRVDTNFFKNGEKNLRFQKYPDTCGQGLRFFTHIASELSSERLAKVKQNICGIVRFMVVLTCVLSLTCANIRLLGKRV